MRCGVQRIDAPLASALAAKKKGWSIHVTFEGSTTDADLATVSAVPWLTSVTVESKLVTDVTPLAALTSLANLELRTPKVTTLAPLKSLTALRHVDLLSTWVADVSPFAASKGIETFRMNMPTDLAPLAGLTSLRTLWVSDLKDWTVIKGFTALETFNAWQPTFKDVSFLANATQLRDVNIMKGTALVSIAGLKGVTELRRLSIGDSQVSDLTVLAGMPKLEVLSLYGTPVTSIAALAKTTTLERVDLTGTKVKDLTPLLASAKNLQQLLVPDDTPDSALQPFRKANPKIWFHDTY